MPPGNVRQRRKQQLHSGKFASDLKATHTLLSVKALDMNPRVAKVSYLLPDYSFNLCSMDLTSMRFGDNFMDIAGPGLASRPGYSIGSPWLTTKTPFSIQKVRFYMLLTQNML